MRRKHDDCEEGASTSTKQAKIEKPTTARLSSGHLHLTKVDLIPDCFNETSFSFGELLEVIRPLLSLHFNFMIDVDWLMSQYPAPCSNTPVTLVVGEKMGTEKSYIAQQLKGRPNMTVHAARLPLPFGTHHTKLSLLESDTHIHVIVSTANLVPGDWGEKTQGFYYAAGAFKDEPSDSQFRDDLVEYMQQYKLDALDYWVERLKLADFDGLADRIIYSVPGYHKGNEMKKVGHLRLRQVLSKLPQRATEKPLYSIQCSSIGSLGSTQDAWLLSQFLNSLRGGRPRADSRAVVIYPCVEDVRQSVEGYQAGGSLPYQSKTAERQPWLNAFFCKWRSETMGRSRAMPHIKTYTEILDRVPQWMLLTSANLSKAAWGELQKNSTQLMVRSYELGVLITDSARFSLPYDYPMVKYTNKDVPWIVDKTYNEVDSKGGIWQMD